MQPVVQLLDARGRQVRQAGVEITASIGSGPGPSASVENGSMATNAAGQAVYRALAITGPLGSYRLSFAGPGLAPVTSNELSVSAPLVGNASDPLGDMNARGADLVSATVAVVRGDSLFISVRWAPGGFVRDTSQAVVHLDLDQNPATGHPGINSTGSVDGDLIGSEFLVVLGASQDPVRDDLRLFQYAGQAGQFIERSLANSVAYVEDGMEAMVSLSLLGPDDGVLHFKLVSVVKVSASGFSGWLDVAPDVGQAAAAVGGAPPAGLAVRNGVRPQ